MQSYRYSLAITSQFFYCGLPLRLDSYSACQYSCQYCFARARGGAGRRRPIASADVDALGRRLERVLEHGRIRSALDEFLGRRQPIHLGGMTDPFPQLERRSRTTHGLLELLANYNYPTIISTKADLLLDDVYLHTLARGTFAVQVSLSSLDAQLLATIDAGTPSPRTRLNVLQSVAEAGIPTACRIQPVLPTREQDVEAVIEACADACVKHVAIEHLKLPIETTWAGTRRMSRALQIDLPTFYRSRSAARVGREWILPAAERLERMIRWRAHVHSRDMTFGAADNDLLLLSDGNCCCSGADLLSPAFGAFSTFTYTEAVRRGAESNRIEWGLLAGVWRPEGPVTQYINSRSRVESSRSPSVTTYLERSWNGAPNGNSPQSLHGVTASEETDGEGRVIYTLDPRVRQLTRTRRTNSA